MKKNKVLRFAVFLFILLLCGGIFFSWKISSLPHRKVLDHIEAPDIKEVSIYGDKNQYVLTKNFKIYSNRFLVGYSHDVVEGTTMNHWNFKSFVSYDLDNNMSSKTIIYNKQFKNLKNIFVTGPGIPTDYQNIMELYVSHEVKFEESQTDIYYFNLESNKVYDSVDSKWEKTDSIYDNFSSATNISDVIEKVGYDYGSTRTISVGRKIKKSGVESNREINLFTEFPGIEKKLIDDGYTLVMRSNLVSDEEIFNNLLHWFAPKGQSTLSGVQIKAEYSKDGQAHEIHSYAEFQQYFQAKGGS